MKNHQITKNNAILYATIILSLFMPLFLCCSNENDESSTSTEHFALNPNKVVPGTFDSQIEFAHKMILEPESCGSTEWEIKGMDDSDIWLCRQRVKRQYQIQEYSRAAITSIQPQSTTKLFQDYRSYCSGTMITPNHVLLAGHCGKLDSTSPGHAERLNYRAIDLGGERTNPLILTTYAYNGSEPHEVTSIVRFLTLDRDFMPVIENGNRHRFFLPPGYSYQDFNCFPVLSIWYTHTSGQMEDLQVMWCGGRDHEYSTDPPPMDSAPGLVYGAVELQSNCDGLPACDPGSVYCCDPNDEQIVDGQNYDTIFGSYQVGEVAGTAQNSLLDPDPGGGPHYRSNVASYLFFRRPDSYGLLDVSFSEMLLSNLFVCHGFSGSSIIRLRGIGDEENSRIIGVAAYAGVSPSDICYYSTEGETGLTKGPPLVRLFDGTTDLDADSDPEDGIIDFLNDYFLHDQTIHFVDRHGASGRWFVKARFAPWMRYFWRERGLDGNGSARIHDSYNPVTISIDDLGLRATEAVRMGFKASGESVSVTLEVLDDSGTLVTDPIVKPLDSGGVRVGLVVEEEWATLIIRPLNATQDNPVTIEDLSIVEDSYEWAFDNVEERGSWKCGPDPNSPEPPRTVFNEKGFAGQVYSGNPLINETMNIVGGHVYVLDMWVHYPYTGREYVNGTVTVENPAGEDLTYDFSVPKGKGWDRIRKELDLSSFSSDWVFPRISFSVESGGVYYVDSILLRVSGESEPDDPFCHVDDGHEDDPDGDNLRNTEKCDNCFEIRNEDQFDSDFDGIGDECDNCPYRYNPFAYQDPDFEGPYQDDDINEDGAGDACDNCLTTANPSQENCNYAYEESHDLEFLGDRCDPDPCVALCSYTDAYGHCELDEVDIVDLTPERCEGFGSEGEKAKITYYNKGYIPGPIHFPKKELLQQYWCSCWKEDSGHPDGGYWLDDAECKKLHVGGCVENGQENVNRYDKTGWFPTIRETSSVIPIEYDEGTFWESPPEDADFGIESRVQNNSVVLWRDERVQYPEGTGTDFQRLKFWFRPINRDHYYNEDTWHEKTHPQSHRDEIDGTDFDWNNTYIPATDIAFRRFPIFSILTCDDIIFHSTRGSVANMDMWTKRHPGVEKLEEWLPWLKDEECGAPWDFVQLPENSAITGIAFMRFEPWTGNFSEILTSRGEIPGQVPGENNMAFTRFVNHFPGQYVAGENGISSTQSVTILAFGGINAAGNYTNKLWTAERILPQYPEDSEEAPGPIFLWRRVNGYDETRPEARAHASIFTIPASQQIFVLRIDDPKGLSPFNSIPWSLPGTSPQSP